ncbi:winged helix-turn-helix transcriptional regulator [Streptomyces sp. NPDC058451]|uniref:winged helix-turn-helix transcriptional regulator n=1 Tax=Streptomyces sp. NPDC058451 TaxID=3346506 RepID=UPI00365A0FE0
MSGPRRGNADGPCPIGRAADILGDRWTLLIMRNATSGATRFDEFKTELGIADNILSNRLNRLVETGLLVRVPYRPEEGGRTRDECRLTQAGEDMLPVLHAMMVWGTAYSESASPTEPMRLVHSEWGESIEPGRRCPRCRKRVPRSETAWIRPWRGHSADVLGAAVSVVQPEFAGHGAGVGGG